MTIHRLCKQTALGTSVNENDACIFAFTHAAYVQERMRKNSTYAHAHHVIHCINVLEDKDRDQPLVKRRKLSEHTDSSCPRNADPQGERGDREPGDNKAYFSDNFKSVCSSVLSVRKDTC